MPSPRLPRHLAWPPSEREARHFTASSSDALTTSLPFKKGLAYSTAKCEGNDARIRVTKVRERMPMYVQKIMVVAPSDANPAMHGISLPNLKVALRASAAATAHE